MSVGSEVIPKAGRNGKRLCPACFSPLGFLRRRCKQCGYNGSSRAHDAPENRSAEDALSVGMVLQNRYAVGSAIGIAGNTLPCAAQAYRCYDRVEQRKVRLTAYPEVPGSREAFMSRAAALKTLSGCDAVATVIDAFAAEGLLLAVTEAPEMTLEERARPLGDTELIYVLHRLTDALLVVHSLDRLIGEGGDAVHGAPCAADIWLTGDGRVRVFVPPVPRTGEPADDIRGFGRALSPLTGELSKAMEAILLRMCGTHPDETGGYASVLEIKHELNCL